MSQPVVLDPSVVGVTIIKIIVREHTVGSATGFFYKENGNKYLITNRHVVIDEKRGLYPDSLEIRIHTSPNSTIPNRNVQISLYENSIPLWLEHSQDVDVIALNIDTLLQTDDFMHFWTSENILPIENTLMIGGRTIIPGYPYGFYDEIHNLPIIKTGTIASSFRSDFRSRPYFLIDTNLQPGMSGSPVLTAPGSIVIEGESFVFLMDRPYLIGVHSAEHLARTPRAIEELGLNVVWYARLIPELLSQT